MLGTRTELLLEDSLYLKRLYDYDETPSLIYTGKHPKIDAAAGDAGWYIWKNTWTGTVITMTEGPLIGTWTGRASLGWAT
jgi:hypothetical protein